MLKEGEEENALLEGIGYRKDCLQLKIHISMERRENVQRSENASTNAEGRRGTRLDSRLNRSR